MEAAGYIALARQDALWRQMSSVAHNIANMNTAGFKREGMMFTEYVVKTDNQESLFDRRVAYPQDFGMVRDMADGPMQTTENPLDVAIQGEGFFAVETENGPRYTRNGHFKLDIDGQIVDTNGNPVLSNAGQPFFIAPNETQIEIARDGTVSTENGPIGQLQVVRFDNPRDMQLEGGHLLAPPPGAQPQPVDRVQLSQGMIEQSNVDPITEITRMIKVQRSYESIQQMIDEENERQKEAINTFTQLARG